MIGEIFKQLFYRPIFNLLVLFVLFLPKHDLGIAIIFLTIFVRLILHPLNMKALKQQKIITELQPKMKEIQQRFKNDKEKLTQEALKIWQENKINPFGSVFLLFIQLPVLFALFFTFRGFALGVVEKELANLYFFVPKPSPISPLFLGFWDLSKSLLIKTQEGTVYYWPALPLVLITMIIYFFQTKTAQPKLDPKEPAQKFQKNFFYLMFLFFFYILIQLPLAISLYWLTSSVFSLIQQRSVSKAEKNG